MHWYLLEEQTWMKCVHAISLTACHWFISLGSCLVASFLYRSYRRDRRCPSRFCPFLHPSHHAHFQRRHSHWRSVKKDDPKAIFECHHHPILLHDIYVWSVATVDFHGIWISSGCRCCLVAETCFSQWSDSENEEEGWIDLKFSETWCESTTTRMRTR